MYGLYSSSFCMQPQLVQLARCEAEHPELTTCECMEQDRWSSTVSLCFTAATRSQQVPDHLLMHMQGQLPARRPVKADPCSPAQPLITWLNTQYNC